MLVTSADINALVILSSIQLVACSVEIKDIKIDISAETRQPISSPPATGAVSWKDWTWPEDLVVDDPRLIAVRQYSENSEASLCTTLP